MKRGKREGNPYVHELRKLEDEMGDLTGLNINNPAGLRGRDRACPVSLMRFALII